jgi:hypothetical protein
MLFVCTLGVCINVNGMDGAFAGLQQHHLGIFPPTLTQQHHVVTPLLAQSHRLLATVI